ncbi:SEC14-like protein 2 [Daphnia carinata]|uniref:SEC14-like protein 2 n=1 Tax=Daphnia carinata TaxID=120202 RepID=UPI002579EF74|nr:SEC14-like protein 2 [Daphnia carinata]XP_057372016.1 SEC14-like protein 2 [Daphnia carinata]
MDLKQLNDDQRATLEQFREAVNDCKLPDSSDVYLLRWLIARDFNIAKAETMLRKSLEWRQTNRVDEMIDESELPEVMRKYFAVGHTGVDKYKSYTVTVRYGAMDMKGILLSVKKKNYFMYLTQKLETSIREAKTNPERYTLSPTTIYQVTIILDLAGFSMRHITFKPALDICFEMLQMNETNYPEFLRRVFVINAPKIFSILYSLSKPFMHEKTTSNVRIYGYNVEQWKAALLEDFDPQELPACYGGTLTDPDGNPNCITMVNMGGEVPKSYYFTRNLDATNKKCFTVPNGSKEQLEFQVTQAGAILKWDFHSEGGDIAFAVYRKEDSQLIAVVPHDRIDCHVIPEEGLIHCDETGVYVVEFDNSFSYFRSKNVWYSITIESSTSENQNDK